jgi:hypothetical protein
MLNLDLIINYIEINLGEKLNQNIIEEAKLKKLGFLSSIFLRKPWGTIIYWAQNCHIKCLDSEIELIPRLEVSDGPLIFGTSAFLYTANGVIYKIVYQLLDNKDIAIPEYDLFFKVCTDIYGEPVKRHEKLCIWEDEQSSIISELSENKKNYFVYWLGGPQLAVGSLEKAVR